MPRLKRVDCSSEGIARRKAGKGFTYVDASGSRVKDPDVLERIRCLAIPPAWTDVWICSHEMGHIQATGTDAKGRRQYLYHDKWRERRDREKFDHMIEFARVLPKIRHFAEEHLKEDGLTRSRVLACAVRLLDLGFFRIGTEGYAEENQTYGLATIQKRHVRIEGDVIVFDYTAKSGQRRIEAVADPDVLAVVTELKARRGGGPELLAYRRGRSWVDVKSTDINSYIGDVAGGEFTAKDFRTWSATVLASVALAVSTGVAWSEPRRKRAVARAIKEVATYLGNTPAVCRSSYVDPRIIDRYTAGDTVLDALVGLEAEDVIAGLTALGAVEEAVLDLLAD